MAIKILAAVLVASVGVVSVGLGGSKIEDKSQTGGGQ